MEDRHFAVRADAVLAVYDLPDGTGCEVNFTAVGLTHTDVLTARVAEPAAAVVEMINKELARFND